MKKPSSPEAILNIEEAMALVEEAQLLMERAAQKLSPIRNGMPFWNKAGKFYDQLHRFWYALQQAAENRGGMSLDSQCPKCFFSLKFWKIGDPPHRCGVQAFNLSRVGVADLAHLKPGDVIEVVVETPNPKEQA